METGRPARNAAGVDVSQPGVERHELGPPLRGFRFHGSHDPGLRGRSLGLAAAPPWAELEPPLRGGCTGVVHR